MHLIDQLNRALKYGRAPEDMIRMGAKAAGDETGVVHPDNVHDLKMQDLLQEHDDPRELIVRKALEQRKSLDSDGLWEAMYDLVGPLPQHTNHESYATPDGELHFNEYTNSRGKQAITADWYITHPSSSKSTLRNYYATVTPEEAKHIKDNLPDLKRLAEES